MKYLNKILYETYLQEDQKREDDMIEGKIIQYYDSYEYKWLRAHIVMIYYHPIPIDKSSEKGSAGKNKKRKESHHDIDKVQIKLFHSSKQDEYRVVDYHFLNFRGSKIDHESISASNATHSLTNAQQTLSSSTLKTPSSSILATSQLHPLHHNDDEENVDIVTLPSYSSSATTTNKSSSLYDTVTGDVFNVYNSDNNQLLSIGAWEKHTKRFGSRLLGKMGYKR
jgi:hypothetical protein